MASVAMPMTGTPGGDAADADACLARPDAPQVNVPGMISWPSSHAHKGLLISSSVKPFALRRIRVGRLLDGLFGLVASLDVPRCMSWMD
jgi:hypothetical protein